MNPEKEEYELQHFQFCSEDIIAENRLMVKALIQQTLVSFTDDFINKHKMSDEAAMEMRSKCFSTSGEMFAECGAKLDELSKLYKSTFTIPDAILLPTDLMHRKGCSVEQVESLQTMVNKLEQQIRQDGVFLSMLEEEIKLHERLGTCFEKEKELMDLVDQCRQLEIAPAEDCAVVQELADIMKDVLQME